MHPVLTIIVVIIIIGINMGFFVDFISSFSPKQANKILGPKLMFTRLRKRYKWAIEDNMPYYQNLNDKDKVRFEKRVQRFIDLKEFVPRGNLDFVTDEMKALVAGTAIKLTFGYPFIYLTHFWRILLYDDNYYSEITKKYHKGEVNGQGLIILSWNNFLHGHVHADDGVHLGLHEMAHALRLENAIRNEEYSFLHFDSLYQFTILAKREIEDMKAGKTTMFRKYAMTNEHEFFSVAVENFFERPGLFIHKHPKMYEAMRRILLQDPLEGKVINYS